MAYDLLYIAELKKYQDVIMLVIWKTLTTYLENTDNTDTDNMLSLTLTVTLTLTIISHRIVTL